METSVEAEPLSLLSVSFADIRNLHVVLLGRPVNSSREMMKYISLSPNKALQLVLTSSEFCCDIVAYSTLTGLVAPGRFEAEVRPRCLKWASDFFPLSDNTRVDILKHDNWLQVLRAIISDQIFTTFCAAHEIEETLKALCSSRFQQLNRLDAATRRVSFVVLRCLANAAMFAVAYDPDNTWLQPNLDTAYNLVSLTPINGLSQVGKTSIFNAAGDDPQFAIADDIPPGIYFIGFDASYLAPTNIAAEIGAKLYLDFGDGFREENTWELLSTSGRLRFHGVLQTRKRIRSLRFDPSHGACSVQIDEFTMKSLQQSVL